MNTRLLLTVILAGLVIAGSAAAEHDFYRYLGYPNKPVPEVGRDKVDQEGGPNATGYKRRTVQWWPRKGQDIVDIPEGAPLRVWTRNKGQDDPEALAGIMRNWTASDPEKFKAHLIGFRGFGTSTMWPDARNSYIPVAILRMKNGEQRAVMDHGDISRMLCDEDHKFIHEVWEKAFPKLYAKTSRDESKSFDGPGPGGAHADVELKLWTKTWPKFNAIDWPKEGAKYPRWGRSGSNVVFETPHFYTIARPKCYGGHWGQPAYWVRPHEPEKQNLYRKNSMEFIENMWTYVEAAGASMPYWRWMGDNYKFIIHIHGNRCAGGSMHCGITDCSPVALGHEFFHSMPGGGWDGHYYETMCNAGQHTVVPSELQMFNGNFCYPWCNVNRMAYQSSLWCFVLGDNPNWGHGIPVSLGSISAAADHTPYHAVAQLGQKKGLWKNGVKGFGDFFGEYAARMVTCDFIEQDIIRSKYGMPEQSHVYPVYGHKNRYRISNAEAPRWCGYNIIRLKRGKDVKEIAIDFHGIYDPAQHSDWRACIVAVDANGRARYSPLWNKGKIIFALKETDKHLWLTVASAPSAFPVLTDKQRFSWGSNYLTGIHAPRYPWEVTLTGCQPGLPHRKQGDIVNFDELYGICDNNNKFLDYSVKRDVPIPLTDPDGKPAQKKLADMLPRIKASQKALKGRIASGRYGEHNWWVRRKTEMLEDLTDRVAFLQCNAKGRPHPNGGGFVSDNAKVAPTAYVGPNAMVLDSATVKDNACIREFAVVYGPKTVISGNAKIGGRAWVFGDLKVSGNARIMEAAAVTTTLRTRYARHEGQAEIKGSVVIKGDPFVCLSYTTDQTLTGGIVIDYTPNVANRQSGVFKHGRFYRNVWGRFSRMPGFVGGVDAGALYANWQFNQPKTVLLEDSYVNNSGVLYGKPGFAEDGDHRCIVFNGTDQYAQTPPTVADFGELTIDMLVNRAAGKGGRLFDFGTGADECFYLSIGAQNGKPSLTARHKGKSYSVTASEGIAAGKWVRLRVEMDGKTASIYVDGKKVAGKAIAFAPRDVFIGDRPEGNFIACGRERNEFFAGKMDHFRIYRKVHKDFNAVGPAPYALTQMAEWSEKDQDRHDAWEGRRKAKEAEIRAGKYGQMQKEIRDLYTKRSKLDDTAKLKKLEVASRKADQARGAIDRKIRDELRKLTQAQDAGTEKEIKVLNEKISSITNKIMSSSERKKLEEEIRACEKKRGEVDREARESPKLKAMSAKADAADKAKQEAEEKVKELPALKKLLATAEKERDGKKKNQLRDKYNRLLAEKRASDPKCQKATIAAQRLRRSLQEAQRQEFENHPGRKKVGRELDKLRKKLDALTARLRESHPELSKLQESVRKKQAARHKARKEIEDRLRKEAADDFKKADAARTAARKAIADERKRIEERRKGNKEYADITARIEKLQKESHALREDTLRIAGLLGQNPYPGASAAGLKRFQEKIKYHTTADWDYRVREEVNDKVPPKMKKWLLRVRGY